MLRKDKFTHKFQGGDREKKAVYLGFSFMATMDGGKTRFKKDISYLAYFKDLELFDRFMQEVKMGETVTTVQIREDFVNPIIIEFNKIAEAQDA